VDRAPGIVSGAAPSASRSGTFRDVFGLREFRALWLAQLLSLSGDQLARVALTILVFDRTHSALWAAVTYAVSLLPWLIGGTVLAGLADRFPRREVMVASDLARTVLVMAMVLVSLLSRGLTATWVMVALLFLVTLLDAPFKSARSALLPDILTEGRYPLGLAITQTTIQVSVAAGFAVGGVVVAFLGIRAALLLDAGTFVVSALLTLAWVRQRPAASDAGTRGRATGEMLAGIRMVFGDRRLRTLILFGWLVAFYVVPMGLAAPYAATLHGSLPDAVATGLVFAAGPFGTAVGAILFGRLVSPETRQRWMGPLAVAACGTLLFCALRPGLAAALVIIAVSGACACYQVAANAAFVSAVPAARRGQAFGLASGGMQISQGLLVVLAGAAASLITPGTVIAISGGAGGVLAVGLALSWLQARRLRVGASARAES
jgi:MFS family permease